PDRERGRAADQGGREKPLWAPGCHHDPARLPARPASVRTVLPALGADRSYPCPAARLPAQKRHTLGPPADRHRTAGVTAPSARAGSRPVPIRERAGSAHERGRLPPDDYQARESREDAI